MRLLSYILTFCTTYCYGQLNNRSVDLIENNSEKNIDITYQENNLFELSIHPLNLNKATREDLLQSSLFRQDQINAILNYRSEYLFFVDLEELRTLSAFNNSDLERVKQYLYCKSSNEQQVKNRHQQFLIRTKTNSTAQKDYPSSPFQHFARYRIANPNTGAFGFSIENDIGEGFNSDPSSQIPADYLGYYFIYKPRYKKTKVAIGNYTLQFGQGLHFWNGFGFSKSIYTTEISKHDTELREFSSSSETNNLHGLAVSYGHKINLTGFYSNKKIDGSITSDSSFSNFQYTGLHRTPAELNNKDQVIEKIIGTRVSYNSNQTKIGITSSNIHFSKYLIPNGDLYLLNRFSGNSINSVSLDIHQYNRKIEFYGESILNNNLGMAHIYGATTKISSSLKSSFAFRHFNSKYFSRYFNVLSESSTPNNEKGLYFGFTWQPHPSWVLSSYIDQFEFPWLQFSINSPSKGVELVSQINHQISPHTHFYIRWKTQEKEANHSGNIVTKKQHKIQLQLNHQISRSWTYQTRVNSNLVSQETTRSNGWAVSHAFNYKQRYWSFYIRHVSFSTNDFNSRIYAYENDVRYSFSSGNYYGKGQRIILLLNKKASRHTSIGIRYSLTRKVQERPIHELKIQLLLKV